MSGRLLLCVRYRVQLGHGAHQSGIILHINTDGELVVEEKYFDAGVFSPDGAACVKSVAAWSFLVLCEYDS